MDPEEAKKEEARRLKREKRKKASERAKKKEVAWRDELARIELERKTAPQKMPACADVPTRTNDDVPTPTLHIDKQSSMPEYETPALETTESATGPPPDSARDTPSAITGIAIQPYRNTPPATAGVSQPHRNTPPVMPGTAPRDDIQVRIQQYQDRRLLEEKEKDERIAKEKARRDEQLVAEARTAWEKERAAQEHKNNEIRLADEEQRAQAIKNAATAVQEIRLQQHMARQAEMARVERERAQLEAERANEERIARERAQEQAKMQLAEELERRQREQELAVKEQTALEEARRNQIQERIRQEQELVRPKREQAEREQLQREREQEQARREQQSREHAFNLEQARRQQAQFEHAKAVQMQAQRDREEEQARREQAIRENRQREQAQQHKLALERAQREQAEDQKRRELALAQAQEQARRDQEEARRQAEQLRQERAAQEETRRQAEQLRQERERTAQEAANARERLAAQNKIQADSLLSRTQSNQHRNSVGDYQSMSPQYDGMPTQNISIPASADILSASGSDSFSGRGNLLGGQRSTQLVSPNVMMELQSAMISVQSQIIATQSKLYGLQNELNGPDRSILKHVQHNLLTEQLQSMVSMYNRLQSQISSRQQHQPPSQRSAPAQYTPEPSHPAQQRDTAPSNIPNQRPHITQPAFQPSQAFPASQFVPTQQSRGPQPTSWQQMRSDTQSPATGGSSTNGNPGINSRHQADSNRPKETIINGQRSTFLTRQPLPNPRPPQLRPSGQSLQPRPAQRPSIPKDSAPNPRQVQAQARPTIPAPVTRDVRAEQPSLLSLYPPKPASSLGGQPQGATNLLRANDRQSRGTSTPSAPATSLARSKSPPTKETVQDTVAPQKTPSGLSQPDASDMRMIAQSKVQNYLESHSLAAKAQLLNAQHTRQMQLAQMARTPSDMGGLSRAMSMDQVQPMRSVTSVPSTQETHRVPTSLIPAPLSISSPFDPYTPAAIAPSPFLLGDVDDIVALPTDTLEDVAARFTEVHESPNKNLATRLSPYVSHKPASSRQVPVQATRAQATSNNSSSNGEGNHVAASVISERRNSPASNVQVPQTTSTDAPERPTPQVIPSQPAKDTSRDVHTETAAPPTTNPRASDVRAITSGTIMFSDSAPSHTEASTPLVQVATKEPPSLPVSASVRIEPRMGTFGIALDTSTSMAISQPPDDRTSRTRQRSESSEAHAVEERPTKRRRTDQVRFLEYLSKLSLTCLVLSFSQSRFMPPREDVSSSPNRPTSANIVNEDGQRRADKPSWKALSDSSDTESESEIPTVTATTTVVLDQPRAPTKANETLTVARPATPSTAPTTAAPSSAPSIANGPSPSPSQQAAKASSVRLTLEKVFQKNPHPSDAVFDKLATALKIEDVEPVKKLFALWRQNGHKPNMGSQS